VQAFKRLEGITNTQLSCLFLRKQAQQFLVCGADAKDLQARMQ
jgi:hypothetical protein